MAHNLGIIRMLGGLEIRRSSRFGGLVATLRPQLPNSLYSARVAHHFVRARYEKDFETSLC